MTLATDALAVLNTIATPVSYVLSACFVADFMRRKVQPVRFDGLLMGLLLVQFVLATWLGAQLIEYLIMEFHGVMVEMGATA